MAAVSTEVEVWQAILDLCPEGHKKHTQALFNLACSFRVCYKLNGNISDLNRAIGLFQARIDLCPPGQPGHATALGGLAISLWEYFEIHPNQADLDKIIEMQQKRLDLCPLGHYHHTEALGHLAASFRNRYKMQGNMADLNKAIDMQQKRLNLCPVGHLEHTVALDNLAFSLSTRYNVQHNLADLNEAMLLRERCLILCPVGHPGHADALCNLARSFRMLYAVTRTLSDLTRAIKLFEEALAIYPVQHKFYAQTIGSLAKAILLCNSSKKNHPSEYPFLPAEEAFKIYELVRGCGPAVTKHLWAATQAWMEDAEKHNHPSVLEAYQTSLNTLNHFTSMQSSLDSRHETMQARVADLANNAFSCAVRHVDLPMAVELLEQGRGILWSQLARFDISLVALESRDSQRRELGSKFTRLSGDLREHAQGNGGKGMDPYWRVQEEWQSVVDKIRQQEGFSRFLLPPQFDDLQRAAEGGPVIIVNASKYTCDALIILHTRSPVHVPLDCSLEDVVQLCSQFSELIQDAHAYGQNRQLWVKRALRDLWTTVVEPIAETLQNDVRLPLGSRIWWCPASKFTLLPLHAAGSHRKDQKNFMDLYVSSYAPSLSALIRARERARAQKMSRDASSAISFAAVGQAKPSEDQKLRELSEVDSEIRKIQNETNMPPNVKFETVTGDAATIEGAVQAFREHRWIHLACHGAQHAMKPFESWFAMRDGPLTLMRIIQERYTGSEFAFLSACHTAVGDASTPDEVLHLAGGMQFAGFNGVIGTLWRVDDAIAHQVVTRFYKEMFGRPVLDFEHAAEALNVAVAASAKEVPLEKRIVFVHIGI